MCLVSFRIIKLRGVKPLLVLHSELPILARGCSIQLAVCCLQWVLLPSAPYPHPGSYLTSAECSPPPSAFPAHISTTHIQPWTSFSITQRLPAAMDQARKDIRRLAQHFMVCHPASWWNNRLHLSRALEKGFSLLGQNHFYTVEDMKIYVSLILKVLQLSSPSLCISWVPAKNL